MATGRRTSVQRWLKFVKYLPDFGIQPIVCMFEDPTYPIVDANLIKKFRIRQLS
jgi:hypothetical protein